MATDKLLKLLQNISPVYHDKYGLHVPYGDLFSKLSRYYDNSPDLLNLHLHQLEKINKLDIIYMDPNDSSSILGIRLK